MGHTPQPPVAEMLPLLVGLIYALAKERTIHPGSTYRAINALCLRSGVIRSDWTKSMNQHILDNCMAKFGSRRIQSWATMVFNDGMSAAAMARQLQRTLSAALLYFFVNHEVSTLGKAHCMWVQVNMSNLMRDPELLQMGTTILPEFTFAELIPDTAFDEPLALLKAKYHVLFLDGMAHVLYEVPEEKRGLLTWCRVQKGLTLVHGQSAAKRFCATETTDAPRHKQKMRRGLGDMDDTDVGVMTGHEARCHWISTNMSKDSAEQVVDYLVRVNGFADSDAHKLGSYVLSEKDNVANFRDPILFLEKLQKHYTTKKAFIQTAITTVQDVLE